MACTYGQSTVVPFYGISHGTSTAVPSTNRTSHQGQRQALEQHDHLQIDALAKTRNWNHYFATSAPLVMRLAAVSHHLVQACRITSITLALIFTDLV